MIYDVTPAEFEAKSVLGNTGEPELHWAEGELVAVLGSYDSDDDYEVGSTSHCIRGR